MIRKIKKERHPQQRKASSATLGKKSHPSKKARIQQQSCGNLEFYDRDKAFYEFTNFSAHTVAYEGHSFSVSECAFQWRKFKGATHPKLIIIANKIMSAKYPRDAFDFARGDANEIIKDSSTGKPLINGKTAQALTEADLVTDHLATIGWHHGLKVKVMEEIVTAKFGSCINLQALLLATDGYDLVEASPVDGYWGYGSDKKGKNMLGILLSQNARETLFGHVAQSEIFQLFPQTIQGLKHLGRMGYFIHIKDKLQKGKTPKRFDEWNASQNTITTPPTPIHDIVYDDISAKLLAEFGYNVAVSKTRNGNLSLFVANEAQARSLITYLISIHPNTTDGTGSIYIEYASDNGPHGCSYTPRADLPFRVSLSAAEIPFLLGWTLGYDRASIDAFSQKEQLGSISSHAATTTSTTTFANNTSSTTTTSTQDLTYTDLSQKLYVEFGVKVAVERTKKGNLSLYVADAAQALKIVSDLDEEVYPNASGISYASDNGPNGCSYTPRAELPFRITVDAKSLDYLLGYYLGFDANAVKAFGRNYKINGY